jgi:hypothetical protein
VYLAVGSLSVLGTLAVAYVYYISPSLRRDHASTLILLITVNDFLYTLKYMVTLAWAQILDVM